MANNPKIKVNLWIPGKIGLSGLKISGIKPFPIALNALSGMIIVQVLSVTTRMAPR